MKPEDISYIRAAGKMGLGQTNLNELRIEEIVANA
jgi:hypothetical protein